MADLRAALVLLGLILWPAHVEAKPAAPGCTAIPLRGWYAHSSAFRVLNGCVTVTGMVSDYARLGALARRDKFEGIVMGVAAEAAMPDEPTFLLKPDQLRKDVLNSHNLAYLHGTILVTVDRNNLIQGTIRNGSYVQVRAPLVHNLEAGYNELVSVESARVLSAQAAGFPLAVIVSPATMPYNAHPSVIATAPKGAVCTAQVRYSTGRKPVSFHDVTITSSGRAVWTWHEETKGKSGTATVTCIFHGASETKTATFAVTYN